MTDISEKLKKEIEIADWAVLEPHHKRDSLFWISPQLDIVSVAVALANDDVDKVKAWQVSQSLRKPFPDEVSVWEKFKDRRGFQFLIVQPFVIIQEIEVK